MAEIERIELHGVLPEVFRGEENSAAVRASQVWLSDLTLRRGTFYRIDAASGMGKSSLCAFIYGLRHDYVGTITFDGADIARFDIARVCEIRRRHLAYLPQALELFAELTALDNVLLKNSLTDFRTEADIRAMFSRLEIDNRMDSPAGRLSVGQQQRVALIRALCQPFDFLLLDEPVSHLDERNNRTCAQMVAEAARAQGAGVIITSVGNPLMLEAQQITL